MKDFATEYERFMKRTFPCMQDKPTGEIADEYKLLVKLHHFKNNNKVSILQEEFDFDYGFYCGQISSTLYIGIKKFQKEHMKNLNKKHSDILDKLVQSLRFATLETLNSVIVQTHFIMISCGYAPA